MNCTEKYCIMQFDKVDPATCKCVSYCPQATLPVDVVEVVRCKDCIYSPSGDDNKENQGFSLKWPHDDWPERNPCPCKCDDEWYSYKPNPEFYCAHGKREENKE